MDGFSREPQAGVCRPRQWRLIVWQRVKNGWRSSTAAGIRRGTSRWKFFARITAEPINCPSPAAGSMANGATTGPAAWSRPRWSAGGCRASDLKTSRTEADEPGIVPECDGNARDVNIRNAGGTNRARITDLVPYSLVHG